MIAKNKRYRIEGNSLYIDDVRIPFEFLIEDHVEIKNMLIILLSIPVNLKYNENVFGVSLLERKVKWQIGEGKFANEKYSNLHCKYNSVTINGERLILNNWCDTYLVVDPITGKILEKGETR